MFANDTYNFQFNFMHDNQNTHWCTSVTSITFTVCASSILINFIFTILNITTSLAVYLSQNKNEISYNLPLLVHLK